MPDIIEYILKENKDTCVSMTVDNTSALLKLLKKGEIDFDSLPLPIVETEETRQIEEEIKKGMMHFEDDEGRKEIEEGETDEAVASSETQE